MKYKGLFNFCSIYLSSDFLIKNRNVNDLLKNCFENIGLKKFILVNKSTSLALPFLAKNLSDSSKKFILDFGSGENLIFFYKTDHAFKSIQIDLFDYLFFIPLQ